MTAKNKIADLIRRGERLPELLCPAGSYEALCAAIDGGADAIYMGGSSFNARINAKNFTEEEMKRGIALAHHYGAKVYVAANTLIYDRELDGFLRAAERAYLCGADALIIADLGAAEAVRSRIDIELHASTQLSGHGVDASRVLEKAGFSRMVCAREMSENDIRGFIENSSLECEVFVHGALCVCHSGQCLFSSLVGGRSGNRGECAQPCRLPFKNRGRQEYPLSLKDLSLAMHIPTLCDMGISSLKIEGRMKSPEYVRDVTKIWRRLLDRRSAATPDDMKELEAVFSRGGFTDGYFTQRIDRKMLGVRSEASKQATRELAPFEKITRKINADIKIRFVTEEPVMLTVERTDNGKNVTVYGEIPQAARSAPIDETTLKRCLGKLGDTPFVLGRLETELDEGLMLPVSAINALRRHAVEKLLELDIPRRSADFTEAVIASPTNQRDGMRTAVFYNRDAIPQKAYGYFDVIYTPLENYDGKTNGILMPPVIFDSERERISAMLKRAEALGAEHVLIGNIGHLSLVKDLGMTVHGDFRLNVCNRASVAFIEKLGIEDVVVSPELTIAQIRDVGGKTLACVYGRLPLMVTEKCVGKELADCGACKKGRVTLTDRRGVDFPVMRTFEHRSLIFNSVPFYMADRRDELRQNRISMLHFIFTVETENEARQIIEAYEKGLPPKDLKIKRIK